MRRRALLKLTVAATASVAASGHTPYKQWQVYRQKHLLIGASRADTPTYPLARQIAALLESRLPESRARVARARTVRRLVSLLRTDQLQVLVVSTGDARAITRGEREFAEFGPVGLAALYAFAPSHLLVVRPSFPARHAWLVFHALDGGAGELAGAARVGPGMSPVPVHPGAAAAARGSELPEEPEALRLRAPGAAYFAA